MSLSLPQINDLLEGSDNLSKITKESAKTEKNDDNDIKANNIQDGKNNISKEDLRKLLATIPGIKIGNKAKKILK